MVRHMVLFVLILSGLSALGQQPAIPLFTGTTPTPDSSTIITVDGKGNMTAEVDCIEGVRLYILTRHHGIVTVAVCQNGWWVKSIEPDVDWGSEGNGGDYGHAGFLVNSPINKWSSESINGWTDDSPSNPDAKVHLFVPPIEPVDVPAVVVGTHMGFEGCGGYACFDYPVKDYACTDKSRILLPPDGNGNHWCHKVQQ